MTSTCTIACRTLFVCLWASYATAALSEAGDIEGKIPPLDLDKRYLAALAKNGRLAKEHSTDREKTSDQPPTWLKKPSDSVEKDSLDPNDSAQVGHVTASTAELKPKRNIAALARLGWLNNARSYRSDPTGIKREDLLYADGPLAVSQEENCLDETLKSSKAKRNIAAMARNGRLPSSLGGGWDYWYLKRNPLIRYSEGNWPSAPVVMSRQYPNGDTSYASLNRRKSKRCSSVMTSSPQGVEEAEESKRNIAAMARKGFLPQRRNVDAMARKGINPRGGVASMARKGLLPSSYPPNRRILSRLARQGMIPNHKKKNAASMARKGLLPRTRISVE